MKSLIVTAIALAASVGCFAGGVYVGRTIDTDTVEKIKNLKDKYKRPIVPEAEFVAGD